MSGYKFNDGWYQEIQYFQSQPGRGYFVPLLGLHPDKRFTDLNEKKENRKWTLVNT